MTAAALGYVRPKGGARQALIPWGPEPWAISRDLPANGETVANWLENYVTVPKGYGAGGPLRLAPFQREMLDAIFAPGTYQAIVAIPRGNGKSTLMAALGVWALFSDRGAQVPILAQSKGQAQLVVFEQAQRMIEASPDLSGRAVVYADHMRPRIVVPSLGSSMFPLGVQSPGRLQGLDPTFALLDEMGFAEPETWAALAQALGKRERGVVVGIGTPGYDVGIMYELRRVALEERPAGLRYLEWAAPADADIDDERVWHAANPALIDEATGEGFKNLAAMRTLRATSSEADFRRFQLGQWVQGDHHWLPPGRWDGLPSAAPPGEGERVWLGFDGSASRDSTALVWATPSAVGLVRLWERPADRDWRVPRADVLDVIRGCFARWDVAALVADPFGWYSELEELAREFGGDRVQHFPTNSRARFAPACDRFYQAIMGGDVAHDGADGLRRHIGNAEGVPGPAGTSIVKSGEGAKVDAAVAAVIAYDAAVRSIDGPATIRIL